MKWISKWRRHGILKSIVGHHGWPTRKIMSGCTGHTSHNAACKAGNLFSNIVSFDIEDCCVDLHH